MLTTYLLAALAGALSILSPCVLPLIPLVLGTAASKGRYGPLLLAAGVVVSYVSLGLFISLIGFSIGLDGAFFRKVSAVMLLAMGLVLAVPLLTRRFALAAGPLSNFMDQRFGQSDAGQFAVGLLLGAVWSPCTGPTLGAAALLASQGQNLGQVALTMVVFGIGVAVPLIALGLMSREVMLKWRGRMLSASSTLKIAMGSVLAATGLLILTGQDRLLEATLVDLSPAWLTALTTQF